MGGYGYFDFGELELRSDEVSRNESYLNSQVQSNLSSAMSSRRHSFTNLQKIASRSHDSHLPQQLQQQQQQQNMISKRNNRFQKELEINCHTVKILYLQYSLFWKKMFRKMNLRRRVQLVGH